MKRLLVPVMTMLAAVALAQTSETAATLKPGSTVKLEPVTSAKWIQGEPLKAFEPGKVYMFECWATWCGPCVASIPHVNDLHKRYSAKGLRVIGMNVWEDGEDKVAKFVKDKGEGMSYPVVYTGKGSVFENDWLKAAGVRGIPHAFIVKDGIILLMTHPAQLTDQVVEALLSGEEGARKAIATLEAAEASQQQFNALAREFQAAAGKGDVEVMSAKFTELEKQNPHSAALPHMRASLLLAKKDWSGLVQLLDSTTGVAHLSAVSALARRLNSPAATDYPADFLKQVTAAYAQALASGRPDDPLELTTLASLQSKTGDKDAALVSARKALASARTQPAGRFPLPPFEKFLAALEKGAPPTEREFAEWWMQEQKSVKSVPAGTVKAK